MSSSANARLLILCNNYHPQRSWGKVIFSEACVKNSVQSRGGGSAPLHAGIHPPLTRGRHPPSAVHAGRYGQQAGGTHPT